MAQRDGLLKQCDCPPEQWRRCAHGWHLAMQHDRTRYSVSLDLYAKRRGLALPRLRGEAEPLADRITREIQTGTYQAKPGVSSSAASCGPLRPPAASCGFTFDQAVEAYLAEEVRPRGDGEQSEIDPATVSQFEARFRRYAGLTLPALGRVGDAALVALTAPVVKALYRQATTGMANSTKHKYRQALVGLVEWAVEQGHLSASPITADTKRKALTAGPDAMRTRRVHPDEEANLLEAAQETQATAGARLGAFLLLALDTAGRKGELLALQWADVLFGEGPMGRIRFAAVERGARKGGMGRARRVPMTARVRALLQTMRLDPTGQPWPLSAYVLGDAIGGRVRDVRKAWVTCVLRAHNHEPQWVKPENRLAPASEAVFARLDVHIHDLRHEGALRWLEQGYTLPTIAALLGHADLATLRVYLGLTERDALAEADRLVAAATVPACSKSAVNRPPTTLRVVGRKEVKVS